MSGLKSRNKGSRVEREFVHFLQARGLGAQRVPNSGSSGGHYAGDVRVWTVWGEWLFEGKARKNGFVELHKWLSDGIDALFLKADRKPILVVMTAEKFAELVEEAERGT